MEKPNNLHAYCAATALSWGSLGIYTVSMSWIVLATTGNTASVGLFYLLASATSLLISPFARPKLKTREGMRFLLIGTGIARSTALIIPMALRYLELGPVHGLYPIFLAAMLFGPANTVFNATSEGWMTSSWPLKRRSAVARPVGLIRQVALALGFAVAGLLIVRMDASVSCAIAAASGLVSTWICLKASGENQGSGHADLSVPRIGASNAFVFILTTPRLLLPFLAATLGFSVSQMANATLAPIMAAQGKSAQTFGFITSAWAVGALAAAGLMNLPIWKTIKLQVRISPLALLGGLCATFAYTTYTPAQWCLFAAMGAVFSYSRIMAGVAIAASTPAAAIGAVQLTLSNFISVAALAVYATPWLLQPMAPREMLAIWGLATLALGLGLTAPTHSPAPAPPDR